MHAGMQRGGHGGFAGELTRFAVAHANPRVTAIAARVAAPLRVVVRGRRGVGRATVARALDCAGPAANFSVANFSVANFSVTGTEPGGAADVVVYVTAEVVKPEDTDAIGAARRVVAVLNKADLVGSLAGDPDMRGGPVEAARRRCAELSAVVGVPLEPMIAPLAVAALGDLDGASWAALRTLATHAGGTACLAGSHADFLTVPTPVPAGERRRLLDTLDLFGVAIGIAALRRGRTPAQVRMILRRLSGVDAVVRGVAASGAEVRYRRVMDAVADLEALAVPRTQAAESIGAFLRRDDTVLARMAAAAELAEAAGLNPADCGPAPVPGPGPPDDDPGRHLARAARWQAYLEGRPGGAGEVRRACGADIARGSLLLWSRACGIPGDGE